VQRSGRRAGAGVLTLAGAIGIAVVPSAVLSAHTAASAAAVAAGSEAVVSFRPEHGCDEAATVGVRVQAPVPDAQARAVEGWTATATPDGAGNTVLEWTGGRLPTDQAGNFPVELVVPDAVGTLLAFPAVQRCENGEELAWIGTAPGDRYPAPQVLVLPAGSPPAATLDEVPADAPGRDLLVALAAAPVVEDAPAAAPTTQPAATSVPVTAASAVATTAAAATTTPATSAPAASTVPAAPTTAAPTTTAVVDDEDGGGSAAGWVIAVVVAVVVIAGAVAVAARRRGANG
jgi:uncharacterized protein YcnI